MLLSLDGQKDHLENDDLGDSDPNLRTRFADSLGTLGLTVVHIPHAAARIAGLDANDSYKKRLNPAVINIRGMSKAACSNKAQ